MIVLFVLGLVAVLLALRSRNRATDEIGFLHPNSGGGGGGERVLWVALKALQSVSERTRQKPKLVLFTRAYGGSSNEEKKKLLLARVKDQFGISIADSIRIVFMSDNSMRYLEPSNYARLTLLRQTIWSGVYMFLEVGVKNRPPAVLVESVGIPFAYPLLRILTGIRVVPYAHYPIISSDMVNRVASKTSTYNNNTSISKSSVLTSAKLVYYRAFSWLYWFCGRFVEGPMVNSSWTADHIEYMWGIKPVIIYPPCNVDNLLEAGRNSKNRKPLVVSVGQFRPEKNHLLQLEAFKDALPSLPAGTKLVLAGGARGEEDLARVRSLEASATTLGLEIGKNVEFKVSRPYKEITDLLSEATVGLHTMTDEHFGIVVVEYQAAGALALAHNSAGPKRDIILSNKSGRLATTRGEYSKALVELFSLSEFEKEEMRACARQDASRFSDEVFGERISEHILATQRG